MASWLTVLAFGTGLGFGFALGSGWFGTGPPEPLPALPLAFPSSGEKDGSIEAGFDLG